MSETVFSSAANKPILVDPASDPFFRICPRCGKTFVASRISQRFCFQRACQRDKAQKVTTNHAARTQRRLTHQKHFVAVDGEGISYYDAAGRLTSHDYVLLGATGCEPLHKNRERLTTAEIFHYLYYRVFQSISKKHPDAVYVGFALGYDWGQWVRDLPENRAIKLFTKEGIASRKRKHEHAPPFPVYWRVDVNLEWELDFLGDNRLRLRPYTGPKRGVDLEYDERIGPNKHPWMYISDVFPFFQCSFLKAIDPGESGKAGLTPVISDEDYRLIQKGKQRRRDAQFDLELIKYNQLECEALSARMAVLNDGIVKAQVYLRKNQYFGPGQVAQQHLNALKRGKRRQNHNAPEAETGLLAIDLTNKAIYQKIPPEIKRASQASYYGGWFEAFYHGIYPGNSYGYDINSAYPTVMTTLPCLLHGKWISGKGDPRKSKRITVRGQKTCLVKATVRGTNHRIGAMLHRDRRGYTLRPHLTAGWYWLHEIEKAQRARLIDTVEYQQWHAYLPECDCAPPLASVASLYEDRLAAGKNSPEGVAKKLICNSLYGKFAQSAGEPTYGNSIYASLITAGCRCMILDFIASHPQGADAILMIATDGIWVTSPHPTIEVSDTKLGAWDHKERTNLCILKIGMYWDDTARERIRDGNYDALNLKTRGVPLRALARRILDFDEQFKNWKEGDTWPRGKIKCDFSVISPRLALARRKWHLCGKVVTDHTIQVNSDPNPYHKRIASRPGWSIPLPVAFGGSIESTPYSHTFGEKDEQGAVYDHPDGDILGQLEKLFEDLRD